MMKRTFAGCRYRLRRTDVLTIAFFLLLNGLIFGFRENLTGWQTHVVRHFIVCLLVGLAVPLLNDEKRGLAHFIRNCYPAAAIPFVYWDMSHFIHLVFPGEFDPWIIARESGLLGKSPNLLLQPLVSPLLTEIMQWFYAVYWIFIPVGATLLYFGRKDKTCDRFMFYLPLTFYIACLGFILFPVVGPRFFLADRITADYDGLLLAGFFRGVVEQGGHRGCAFPSAHAAVSIVVTYFIREAYPRLARFFFLPCVAGLCAAAVYGQYHYITDVAAGIVLGVGIGLAAGIEGRKARLDNELPRG